MNSQCGTGKRASEGFCGVDVHGFEIVSNSASCASIVDMRVWLRTRWARRKDRWDKVKCGKAKMPANLHCQITWLHGRL